MDAKMSHSLNHRVLERALIVEKKRRREIWRKREEARETAAIEAKEWEDEERINAMMRSTISVGMRIDLSSSKCA
jgi:hypothetical protein